MERADSTVEHGMRLVLIVAGISVAAVMQFLDSTIVNVALPTIGGNLGASFDELGWVVTAYSLAAIGVIPLTGWLALRFGRKRYFIFSIVGFTIASALCGLSTTFGALLVSRVIQGLFGGGLVATSQSILVSLFPRERQAVATGIFALIAVLGPGLGPTVGGWLTDQFSWPLIFFINLPLGIFCVIVLVALLKESPTQRRPVDVLGIFLLVSGLAAMQYFLERGEIKQWFDDDGIKASAAWAAIALPWFVVHALRTPHPVLDLRTLRHRNLTLAAIATSALGANLFGSLLVLPLYLQNSLGFTALLAGTVLFVRTVPTALLTPLGTFLLQRGIVSARVSATFGLATLRGRHVSALARRHAGQRRVGLRPGDARRRRRVRVPVDAARLHRAAVAAGSGDRLRSRDLEPQRADRRERQHRDDHDAARPAPGVLVGRARVADSAGEPRDRRASLARPRARRDPPIDGDGRRAGRRPRLSRPSAAAGDRAAGGDPLRPLHERPPHRMTYHSTPSDALAGTIDLRGRVALVTGGNRGIGAAIVRALHRAGAAVFFTYRERRADADALRTELGERVEAHSLDLADADADALPACVEACVARFGAIDVLVNNAAVFAENPFDATDYAAWRTGWRRTVEINLFAAANLGWLAMRTMRARGEGAIVNVASRAGHRGELSFADYGASKAALINLTKSIARSCAPAGIVSFAVAPGFVDTEMAAPDLAERGVEIAGEIPLGRVATADEVAHVVAFLCTPLARHLNGATLDVNGGSYVR